MTTVQHVVKGETGTDLMRITPRFGSYEVENLVADIRFVVVEHAMPSFIEDVESRGFRIEPPLS